MEILDKIFGSAVKVRLMRLFLLNPENLFSFDEVTTKTMSRGKEVKAELALLEKIGLIKRKTIFRKETPEATRAKKTQVWSLQENFVYLKELQYFLINANLIKHSEIIKKLQRIGKIKSVIIAGVFLNEWEENRLDLLIIGDEISKLRLENMIRQIEAEVGRELKYTIFETSDFVYRMNMYDKLIREVLEYPHQIILDKIGIKR